jgi:hypothetical protein
MFKNVIFIFKELLKTLSNKGSFLSSKRIERALFTSSTLFIVVGTFIYEFKNDKITASEAVILITPLLIAGGYNILMDQKEKKDSLTKTEQ